LDFSDVASLEDHGFVGLWQIDELMLRPKLIPMEQGVYFVVPPDSYTPDFLSIGTGGFFKGRDPNVPIDVLRSRWVEGAAVLNIGKAGGLSNMSTLRRRIGDYLKFGRGRAIAHWGGRYIWQLRDTSLLRVCWKVTDEDPRTVEKALIARFKSQFGANPFANIQS